MQGRVFGFGSARAPSCDPSTPSRIPAQLSDVGRADGYKDPKFADVSRVYLKPFPENQARGACASRPRWHRISGHRPGDSGTQVPGRRHDVRAELRPV